MVSAAREQCPHAPFAVQTAAPLPVAAAYVCDGFLIDGKGGLKKKEAASLGEELASATDSVVAQVVGHSILLFQSNDKEVTGLLTKAGADLDDDGV